MGYSVLMSSKAARPPVLNTPAPKIMTVPRFAAAKSKGVKLSVVTAYDFSWARIFDAAGVDAILVGDSLAMVVQGHSTTLPVTLDEIIYHAKLVVRGTSNALVIVDMPFMSYQVSPRQAVRNAGRIIKESGAAAVKLEGGEAQAETIRALSVAGIPVMAHEGMKPQSVHSLGGMGKIQRQEETLIKDAKAAQEAGAFGIVLELIPQSIAARITAELAIPTIGIGAGPACDGQVLVGYDMLGLSGDFHPRFLKQFADLGGAATRAIEQYIAEVRSGAFPGPEHSHD
jgi:3-methyl-2-oxobutanoate hydroxymethyltransferase